MRHVPVYHRTVLGIDRDVFVVGFGNDIPDSGTAVRAFGYVYGDCLCADVTAQDHRTLPQIGQSEFERGYSLVLYRVNQSDIVVSVGSDSVADDAVCRYRGARSPRIVIDPIQGIAPFGTVVKLNIDCVGHDESVVSVYVIGIFFQLQRTAGLSAVPLGFYHRAVAVRHSGNVIGGVQRRAVGGKGYAVHISRLQLYADIQIQSLPRGSYRSGQDHVIGSAGSVPDKGGKVYLGGIYIHRGTVGERIAAAPDHFVISFVIAGDFAFRVGHVKVNVQTAAKEITVESEGIYRINTHRSGYAGIFGRLTGRNVVYGSRNLTVDGRA